MTALEIKRSARVMTIKELERTLNDMCAVQFDDASFAVLQTVEDKEIWTEITIKSKAASFDPYTEQALWRDAVEKKAAEKAAAKAEQAKREEAKRAAKAKKAED